MNQEQSLRALAELAASPASKWIGNKLLVDGTLLVKCTRCGVEDKMKMPPNVRSPLDVPVGFDEKLFAFKRTFQIAHEGCTTPASKSQAAIADHAYLSAGDTAAASGDRAYTGCFLCGRTRQEHAA